jgi:SWI/SNF-related matrix-associated actin-dependent regulator of chromatin subfamily A3
LPYSPQDQQKIRLAISLRRVDPADIPPSAKSVPLGTTAEGLSVKKKRKADERTSLSSNAIPPPRSAATLTQPSEEEPAEEVAEEEVRDEIYCTMHTSVVGIQYYKGWMNILLSGFIDFS